MIQNEGKTYLFLEGNVEHKRNLAQLIRSLRGFFNLNQDKMGKISGISRPTLSRLERMDNIHKMRHETFEKALKAFADMGIVVHYHSDGGIVVEISPQAFTLAIENGKEKPKKTKGAGSKESK